MSTLAAAGLFRMQLWIRLSAGAGVNECRSRTGQPTSRARPLMLPPACCGCGGKGATRLERTLKGFQPFLASLAPWLDQRGRGLLSRISPKLGEDDVL